MEFLGLLLAGPEIPAALARVQERTGYNEYVKLRGSSMSRAKDYTTLLKELSLSRHEYPPAAIPETRNE